MRTTLLTVVVRRRHAGPAEPMAPRRAGSAEGLGEEEEAPCLYDADEPLVRQRDLRMEEQGPIASTRAPVEGGQLRRREQRWGPVGCLRRERAGPRSKQMREEEHRELLAEPVRRVRARVERVRERPLAGKQHVVHWVRVRVRG